MTTKYNELYNNENYVSLAKAIAAHMGVNYDEPTNEYLDVMLAIQDKAIGYSKLDPVYFPINALRICYHVDVYPRYIDFMGVFATYFHNNG